MTRSQIDVPTLCALSAMAFVSACVSHEALGHGLACIARGDSVEVLTSVYFKCSAASAVVDAAGPSMNLVVAVGAGVALGANPRSPSVRVFLALLVAFSGFWGAGYFVFSGLTDTGDWAFVLHDTALQPLWFWRAAMVTFGAWLYWLALRRVALVLPPGRVLVAAYAAAGAVACASTLFYAGPVGPAMREAAQESLLAALGLPYLALLKSRTNSVVEVVLPRKRPVQALGWVVVATFCLIQGHGYQAHSHYVEATAQSSLRGL